MSGALALALAWVPAQVPETVDPAREAVESYVDATGGGGNAAGFPWVLVVGLVVVVAATALLTAAMRRRMRPETPGTPGR
jgi:ABC-type multidrug transport system permease subunit